MRLCCAKVNQIDKKTHRSMRAIRCTPTLVAILVAVMFVLMLVLDNMLGNVGSSVRSRMPERMETRFMSTIGGHLVVVPGHSVYVGTDFAAAQDEKSWFLESYQRGQLPTLLQHIQEALSIARTTPDTVVVFSGGQTRQDAGVQLSEAQSYWLAAHALGWLNTTSTSSDTSTPKSSSVVNATTEEFARDSYENLLFSLCRYREVTGKYPHHVTVVGFEFKRRRFTYLHRKAVGYPEARFKYVGIDPPNSSSGDVIARTTGENRVYDAFANDLYGCDVQGHLLYKKLSRNPFKRQHPYLQSCPEMRSLLEFCPFDRLHRGGSNVFYEYLPWSYK